VLEVYGIMVGDYSSVRSAQDFYAKMTNLNTSANVKFSTQKIINVEVAANWDNGVACR
jgi:hypothetical protein